MHKMGNHLLECIESIFYFKMQRNLPPQCFSQYLLKYFPKIFLISPLA